MAFRLSDYELPHLVSRADARMVRHTNRKAIFQCLRGGSPLSIAQIARLTGLSLATVKTVIEELVAIELIVAQGRGPSTGGRKPTLYALNDRRFFMIAVDLLPQHLEIGLVTLGGALIEKLSRKFEGRTRDQVVLLIRTELDSFLRLYGIGYGQLVGAGFSIGGLVDTETGVVRLALHLGWEEESLGAVLRSILPIPVFLLEVASSRMIAEMEFGYGNIIRNFLFVLLGPAGDRGISGGVISNGAIVTGSRGYAGQIGHMMIDPAGPLCRCGRRGCWEALADMAHLIDRVNTADPAAHLATAEELPSYFQGTRASSRALAALHSVLDVHAEALVNLVHTFNPEGVVIAGTTALLSELFLVPLRRRVTETAMKPFTENGLRIEVSNVTDSSLRGVAAFALQQALQIRLGTAAAAQTAV